MKYLLRGSAVKQYITRFVNIVIVTKRPLTRIHHRVSLSISLMEKNQKQSSEVTIVFLHIDPSELFGVGNF